MRFKPWQWIVLSVMICAAVCSFAALSLLIFQPKSPTSSALLGLAGPTITPLPSATPTSTYTPTPRPTNTRVVPLATQVIQTAIPLPRSDDYFPLAVDYRWVYQNEQQETVVRTVTEKQIVDGEIYFLVSEQVGVDGTLNSYTGQYRYKLQSDAILLENYTVISGRINSYSYGPFQPIIKIPLSSWPSWSWDGRRYEENTSPVDLQVSWEAYPEKIRLPDQEFEGYRVVAISNEGAVIRWYAAGVGLIEQSIAGSPRESFKLVEYEVGQ